MGELNRCQKIWQRYDELLEDQGAINDFLRENPDATAEDLSKHLHDLAQSEIDEECS